MQFDVVRQCLAEANAGVEHDALGRHTQRLQPRDSLRQELADLGHHVGIGRRLLHRGRLATHVHQAQAGARKGRQHRFGALAAQRLDVVDDVGAGLQRLAHQRRTACVHRHRHAQAQRMAQHRHHPLAFLVGAGRAGARARRLATDVEQIGAFVAQPFAMGDGGFGAAHAGHRPRRSRA